jgi:hypothetical protein
MRLLAFRGEAAVTQRYRLGAGRLGNRYGFNE